MNISQIRSLLRIALKEDLGRGDLTTQALIPRTQRSIAHVIAKESGIFAGGLVAREMFRLRDSHLQVKLLTKEGGRIKKGQKVMQIWGRTQSILEAERTALNFLGHLSGVATLTHQYVEKIRGTQAKIYDTRKTTPLWRDFEKCAVRSGGGENHRLGLYDEVLVKDNHWSALSVIARPEGPKQSRDCFVGASRLLAMTRKRHKVPIEVEVRNLKELAHLVEGAFTPDRVLLDNFSVKELKRAVSFIRGFYQVLGTRYKIRRKPPQLEASGGINLANVRAVAQTGVNRISIGRLTHSAPALDFSLQIGTIHANL